MKTLRNHRRYIISIIVLALVLAVDYGTKYLAEEQRRKADIS